VVTSPNEDLRPDVDDPFDARLSAAARDVYETWLVTWLRDQGTLDD
jgi:hypothetical protein